MYEQDAKCAALGAIIIGVSVLVGAMIVLGSLFVSHTTKDESKSELYEPRYGDNVVVMDGFYRGHAGKVSASNGWIQTNLHCTSHTFWETDVIKPIKELHSPSEFVNCDKCWETLLEDKTVKPKLVSTELTPKFEVKPNGEQSLTEKNARSETSQ